MQLTWKVAGQSCLRFAPSNNLLLGKTGSTSSNTSPKTHTEHLRHLQIIMATLQSCCAKICKKLLHYCKAAMEFGTFEAMAALAIACISCAGGALLAKLGREAVPFPAKHLPFRQQVERKYVAAPMPYRVSSTDLKLTWFGWLMGHQGPRDTWRAKGCCRKGMGPTSCTKLMSGWLGSCSAGPRVGPLLRVSSNVVASVLKLPARIRSQVCVCQF